MGNFIPPVIAPPSSNASFDMPTAASLNMPTAAALALANKAKTDADEAKTMRTATLALVAVAVAMTIIILGIVAAGYARKTGGSQSSERALMRGVSQSYAVNGDGYDQALM
jgi:hypothetical protein